MGVGGSLGRYRKSGSVYDQFAEGTLHGPILDENSAGRRGLFEPPALVRLADLLFLEEPGPIGFQLASPCICENGELEIAALDWDLEPRLEARARMARIGSHRLAPRRSRPGRRTRGAGSRGRCAGAACPGWSGRRTAATNTHKNTRSITYRKARLLAHRTCVYCTFLTSFSLSSGVKAAATLSTMGMQFVKCTCRAGKLP